MKQQKQHCPEVERLMGGRLPFFVTRYGITIGGHCNGIGVCRIALWSGGPSQQLMREIMGHTVQQFKGTKI